MNQLKIKYTLIRIANMDYKKFWKTLKKIHFATGKKRFSLTADIILCGLKYQAGCTDYALFEMYDMTKEERKTVLTRGKNNDLIKKLNNPQYNHIFHRIGKGLRPCALAHKFLQNLEVIYCRSLKKHI